MLLHSSKTDSSITEWLKKKSGKYTHPSIRNEFIKIMALSILRDIACNIRKGVFYTIMADEVTDSSNQEHFVLCLRWVNVNLKPHEEFIGLHIEPNICADTLVACIRDVLIRMNLTLKIAEASVMMALATCLEQNPGMATQIKAEEPRAIFRHCHGHSLQLAVGDMMKEVNNLEDVLDTASEISKLLKFSPKREALFKKLKEDLAPEFPGFRTWCPIRWSVIGGSLPSVIDNWNVLQELWDERLETKLETDIKGRIIRAKYHMGTFVYFYGVNLGGMLLKNSENLFRTTQTSHMCVAEFKLVAALTTKTSTT